MRHVLLLAEARPESGASLALPALAVIACAVLGVLLARPLTRRRHARFVGRTAADLQRLIGDTRLGDVLPSRGRRTNGRTPIPRSALNVVVASLPTRRLVDLVGEDHPVCGLGRHRRPLALPGRRPAQTPAGYWQAYLEGVELVVPSGDGERFFAAEAPAELAEPAVDVEVSTPVAGTLAVEVVAEPEPVVAEPVVAEPVVAEPVVAEPVVAEPAAAEPAAAEPAAVETPAPVEAGLAPKTPTVVEEPAAEVPVAVEEPVAVAEPADAAPGRWKRLLAAVRPSDRARTTEQPTEAVAHDDPALPADDAIVAATAADAARPDVAAEPADAGPRWFDDAPDGRGRSRRSAVLSRVADADADPAGWWNRTPSLPDRPATAAPTLAPVAAADEMDATDDIPGPSFWGAEGPRRVAPVAALAEPPSPEEVEVSLEAAVEAAAEEAAAPAAPVAEAVVQPQPVEQSVVQPTAGTALETATEEAIAAAVGAVPHPRGARQLSARQREALRRASKRLEAASDRFAVAEVACAEARELVDAHVASLVVRSVEGPRVLRQDPDGTGIWGARTLAALMNLGHPLRKVIEGDPLSAGGQTGLLAVPVPAGGTVIGSLIVRRTTGRAFSPGEEGCLERLARMAGTALDASARRGLLLGEGRVDRVTGLGHRDRLVEDLRSALGAARSHGMPTSLVSVEIVGLPGVREALGRPAADEAIAAVGAAVAQSLRVGDVAYRFGVDELAVLLPATTEDDAPTVGRRVADAVASLDLRPGGLGPLALRTAVVPVAGVAEDVVVKAIRALAAHQQERSVEA